MMRIFAIALALSASATVALAAPSIVPYAGYLTDADGAPYEGTVDVRTAIYGCATDAEACPATWEGTEISGIAVTGGMLRFELGGAEDASLAEALTGDGPLWLDIELRTEGAETWTALEPRHGLQAVPFAVSAVNADQLGGMDAADYATAAELAAFTTLEDIATAGYLTDTQLADAGYLMTEALTPYVTTEALEAMGYLTQDDIDAGTYMTAEQVNALLTGDSEAGVEGYAKPSEITAAIADMVTTTALNTTLQTYVTNEALTSTLQDYITATALTESLQPYLLAANTYTDEQAIAAVETVGYLLAADKYTNDEAVEAVEAAGYALKTDIHAPYTNDEAVAAVEAAGYAKAASLLKSIALNQEGELTDQPFIPQSEITIVVDPGVSLGTVAIDFSAKGLVEYVPPSAGGDPGDPELTWATFWRCHIDVLPPDDSELEQVELYDDKQMESLFDVTPRTSTTKTRFHRIYFEAPQAWRDEGFTLQLYCNAFCSPIGSPSSGCEFETAAKASVTTF